MTAELVRALYDVTDYPHPEWCDLTRCSPHWRDDQPGGYHQSAGTLWSVQADEADFIVRVVSDDDLARKGNRYVNHARTRLEVVLRQHAVERPVETSEFYCDAGIDPDDARMLASILTRYADIADRDNRGNEPDRHDASGLSPRNLR